VHAPTVWHDLECGAYAADLPLWREVAAHEDGPILDVGAGTGRVARDLSAHGHEVTALDLDEGLLASLSARDAGVETVVGDARDFELDGRRFGLILAPMQTVQLLGGREGRAAFLRRAREHLEPGGLLAAALTGEIEVFDEAYPLPPPDVTEQHGRRFTSQPVVQREEDGRLVIKRFREIDGPGREYSHEVDVIHLDVVGIDEFEAEARAEGFAAEPRRTIEPTDEHVGSVVVMLRGRLRHADRGPRRGAPIS
jgi:SAM-dependent methyltransferase